MATLSFTNPSFTRPSLGKNIELKNPKRFNLMIRSPSLRITRCTMDVASSPSFDDSSRTHPKFPRMRVWDPYKRLGISKDASEEEIWSSRNFLIQQYAGHERSAESIEGAFERILMDSYDQRKKTKFNLKTRLKKRVEESPSWVKNLLDFVELPPPVIIMRRAFLFAFMAAWSVMKSADGGPAFQVAISLAACIYFLNDKTKSVTRASILGFGGLVAGWLAGSVIVPLVPSVILQPTWTLELLTSLVVYLFLFLSCTFLK